MQALEPHAQDLGCQAELEPISWMAQATGAQRQLNTARRGGRLRGLVAHLADCFCQEGFAGPDEMPDSLAGVRR
jgi:gamma-glutamyl:cysteine ligase YbdK (ATP-grasp superfamily)